ncbi:MAG: patatin-like phospholipase family protein [Rubrivivax sp.]|nr:MAG: patatin-like phospholipase family protein [Rubrivivax sp.]
MTAKAPQGFSPPIEKRRWGRSLPWDTVALVLQGGGALGSYQAGVVEGLLEAEIEPDWVSGISIGALNAAIIAGNPPETRLAQLRAFWETICRPALPVPAADAVQAFIDVGGVEARKAFGAFEAWRAIIEGQQGFFAPRGLAPWLGGKQPTTDVSFYDTRALKSTLERFVDFDRINAGAMRCSVGAVEVHTGNFIYFDNTQGCAKGKLRAEHFMASGALPPGFPAVEIDGVYYWDGGLVSNTPLAEVLDANPRRHTLTFQVDLWSSVGVLPQTIYDVQERQKDIQYSSRTRTVTDMMKLRQKHRRMLREVLDLVPPKVRDTDPWCKKAAIEACARQYAVIHLIYRDKEWEGLTKDYEFSALTMHDHWATGLADIRATLKHPHWLERPPAEQEFVTHDRHRDV